MHPPSQSSQGSSIWRPPIQRQKWGYADFLPHVNWGDLFFDLFYVGAAYNLANIIKTDPSWEGMLYFLGCFGHMFNNFWMTKMMYDAKFEIPNDTVHRVIEILHLCFLAMATQHIRPIELMGYPDDNPEMFLFCLANLVGLGLYLFLYYEIAFIWVNGEDAAVPSAKTELTHISISFIIYVVVTVYSGIQYYGDNDYESQKDNVVIYILFVSWLLKIPSMIFGFWSRGLFRKDIDFKQFSVPLNIEFSIHRFGEWTMLMLGESILSLVIVDDIADDQDSEYYLSFYAALLSVVLLQFLYFKSQPFHAKDHAMRRSRWAGFSYGFLVQCYSAALIVVGVSYKMILTEYTTKYSASDESYSTYEERSLAGESSYSSSKKLSTDERRRRIALIFCCGFAAIFVFLDLMNLAHSGIPKAMNKCHCPEGKLKTNGLILVVFSRLTIVACILALSQYVYDYPKYVAIVGLISVTLQVNIRFLGAIYFPNMDTNVHHGAETSKEHDNEKFSENEEMKWPNTTEPRSSP